MNCKDAALWLHGWMDGELDPVNALAVEQHLGQCPDCSDKAKAFSELGRVIKQKATRHKPSPELCRRIAGLSASDAPAMVGGDAPKPWMLPLKWGAFGASVSMLACLGLFFIARPDDAYLVRQEVLTSHIRSLQEGHLTDVVSTDQHTVKPWFNGRLDFSPPVVDLAAKGFPLAGGRLDYIDGHPVAVLVYKYNAHIVNLFVAHDAHFAAGTTSQPAQQGYNMRAWQNGDLRFLAVSDVSAAKIAEFEKTYTDTAF